MTDGSAMGRAMAIASRGIREALAARRPAWSRLFRDTLRRDVSVFRFGDDRFEELLDGLGIAWRDVRRGDLLTGAVVVVSGGMYAPPERADLEAYAGSGGRLILTGAAIGLLGHATMPAEVAAETDAPAWAMPGGRGRLRLGRTAVGPMGANDGRPQIRIGGTLFRRDVEAGSGGIVLFAGPIVPRAGAEPKGAAPTDPGEWLASRLALDPAAVARVLAEARPRDPTSALSLDAAATAAALVAEAMAQSLEAATTRRCLEAAVEAGVDVAGLRIVWRQDAGGGRVHFLARTGDGGWGVMTRLGSRWGWTEGGRDHVLATIPDEHFAAAADAAREGEV